MSSSSSRSASWKPGWVQFPFCVDREAVLEVADLVGHRDVVGVDAPGVAAEFAVEYSGWNAYGASWQVLEFGVYRMWPNPLATDAVIEPLWCVVRSIEIDLEPGRGVVHVDEDLVARTHQQVLGQVRVDRREVRVRRTSP